jgi:hexokinase
MIISSNFQLNVMQNTEFDEQVDKNSINPGLQMFEKRVSGMFLGEILRRVLISLIQNNNLFEGQYSDILKKQHGIDTSPMSGIAEDSSPHLKKVSEIITQTFGISNPSAEDCRAVKFISDAIVRRSARMAAVAVSAVSDHSGRYASSTPEKPVDVGADGSLVEFYPNYVKMCLAACNEILGEGADKRIKIGLAKDGSGVGAALYLYLFRSLIIDALCKPRNKRKMVCCGVMRLILNSLCWFCPFAVVV